MAELGTHAIKSPALGQVEITGQFATDGSGNPTTATASGPGWTASRTGTGTYRITLAQDYVSLDSAHAWVCDVTPSEYSCNYKTEDVNGATPYVDFVSVNMSDSLNTALADNASAYPHQAGTTPARITAADATALASAKTLALALVTAFAAHDDDVNIHPTADTGALACAAHASAPAEPADAAEVQAVANELKGDWNTHAAKITAGSTDYHTGPDDRNLINAANGSDEATTRTLLNEIKKKFNRSIEAKPGNFSAGSNVIYQTVGFRLVLNTNSGR